MSKPEPLQFETTYHIFNRGNNGETLFREPKNYGHFLNLYIKHFQPFVHTYGYCLLPNHFHFCVSVKSEQEIIDNLDDEQTLRVLKTLRVSDGTTKQVLKTTPSQAFGNLCNAYTKAINKRYQRTGSLFENPFERKRVENAAYFQNLIIYIHQNPQTHGLIDDFRDWPYSSYDAIVSSKKSRLAKTAVLNQFDGSENFIQLHQTLTDFDIFDF